MDFRQFNFRLLRTHMHHTPTHARWSCGKIFVLSSKRTKRTNFRTDEKKTLYGSTCGTNVVKLDKVYTVEPLIMDTLKSGQPPYNGHTVRPLPLYCPYISTSEEGTTSEQWTKCSSPMCPLFGGSTVLGTTTKLYKGCTYFFMT